MKEVDYNNYEMKMAQCRVHIELLSKRFKDLDIYAEANLHNEEWLLYWKTKRDIQTLMSKLRQIHSLISDKSPF